MPIDRRAVAICGHIGTGKSSLAKALGSTFDWDTISFGRYVKGIAHDRGLGSERKTLQDLGQTLIEKAGEDRFLQDVLEFCRPRSAVQLFDGVRHVAMVDAIRRHYDATLTVCLVLDDRARYERYAARDSIPVDYDRFLSWKNHPVEWEIARICHAADLQVGADGSLADMVEATMAGLRVRHYV